MSRSEPPVAAPHTRTLSLAEAILLADLARLERGVFESHEAHVAIVKRAIETCAQIKREGVSGLSPESLDEIIASLKRQLP